MGKVLSSKALLVAAGLVLSAAPSAYATSCSTSAPAGTNACTGGWCYAGETVTVSVSGLAASGTASCGGASATCSTGLSLSCSARSSTRVAATSVLHCSVAGYGASVTCTSS